MINENNLKFMSTWLLSLRFCVRRYCCEIGIFLGEAKSLNLDEERAAHFAIYFPCWAVFYVIMKFLCGVESIDQSDPNCNL